MMMMNKKNGYFVVFFHYCYCYCLFLLLLLPSLSFIFKQARHCTNSIMVECSWHTGKVCMPKATHEKRTLTTHTWRKNITTLNLSLAVFFNSSNKMILFQHIKPFSFLLRICPNTVSIGCFEQRVCWPYDWILKKKGFTLNRRMFLVKFHTFGKVT